PAARMTSTGAVTAVIVCTSRSFCLPLSLRTPLVPANPFPHGVVRHPVLAPDRQHAHRPNVLFELGVRRPLDLAQVRLGDPELALAVDRPPALLGAVAVVH